MDRAEYTKLLLSESGRALLSATEGCRPDMHEPDEQGLTADVLGGVMQPESPYAIDTVVFDAGVLDNANGDAPTGSIELRVRFHREGQGATIINLATLVALARVGARALAD